MSLRYIVRKGLHKIYELRRCVEWGAVTAWLCDDVVTLRIERREGMTRETHQQIKSLQPVVFMDLVHNLGLQGANQGEVSLKFKRPEGGVEHTEVILQAVVERLYANLPISSRVCFTPIVTDPEEWATSRS